MKIEIEVGQVWREIVDKCGGMFDDATVVASTDIDVCIMFSEGKKGMLHSMTREFFRDKFKLSQHQNGADIDTDKYDYAFGEIGDEWHAGEDGWRTCQELSPDSIGRLTLTRTSKVAHLPYCDFPISVNLCSLVWGLSHVSLSHAVNDPKFIGYVYDEGMVSMNPRVPAGENNPAEIPTHVRFAR